MVKLCDCDCPSTIEDDAVGTGGNLPAAEAAAAEPPHLLRHRLRRLRAAAAAHLRQRPQTRIAVFHVTLCRPMSVGPFISPTFLPSMSWNSSVTFVAFFGSE